MIGVLLTQIGTPDQPSIKAVRRYLQEFLMDNRVIEFPKILWWPLLHGIILRLRPRKSAALYQKIWSQDYGSPLLHYSQQLANALTQELNIPVKLGMHYGNPSIPDALFSLQQEKVTHLLLLPLFPQYSGTTSASSFDRVAFEFKTWRQIPALRTVHTYADEPLYIAALAESIKATWEKEGQAEHLLFSFHGIPKRYAAAGDPYPEQCTLTATLVAEKLNLNQRDWSLAYQSRLGKTAWLSPYTDHVLKTLPSQGVKSLQVICPGFSVDCLETLEEIALRGQQQFLAAGGKSFSYIPALNTTPHQIQLFKQMILRNISNFIA